MNNYDELINLLKLENKEIMPYLINRLSKYGQFTDGDNYLFIKGDSPVCLVAHVDTVKDQCQETSDNAPDNLDDDNCDSKVFCKTNTSTNYCYNTPSLTDYTKVDTSLWGGYNQTYCYTNKYNHIKKEKAKRCNPKVRSDGYTLFNSNRDVLGADDRSGVFALLSVLDFCEKDGVKKPDILFTNYEESGARGVLKFISDNDSNTFNNINLFIEFDRRGHNDYVFYSHTLPIKVRKYVESFGFKESFGSFSDVKCLTDSTKIPHINISSGYLSEHSSMEILNLNHMFYNIERIVNMVKEPLLERCEIPPRPTYNYIRDGRIWNNHRTPYNYKNNTTKTTYQSIDDYWNRDSYCVNEPKDWLYEDEECYNDVEDNSNDIDYTSTLQNCFACGIKLAKKGKYSCACDQCGDTLKIQTKKQLVDSGMFKIKRGKLKRIKKLNESVTSSGRCSYCGESDSYYDTELCSNICNSCYSLYASTWLR